MSDVRNCVDCGTKLQGKYCWRCGAPAAETLKPRTAETSSAPAREFEVFHNINWRLTLQVAASIVGGVFVFVFPIAATAVSLVAIAILARRLPKTPAGT